jgi:uncharacterized membrane protein
MILHNLAHERNDLAGLTTEIKSDPAIMALCSASNDLRLTTPKTVSLYHVLVRDTIIVVFG